MEKIFITFSVLSIILVIFIWFLYPLASTSQKDVIQDEPRMLLKSTPSPSKGSMESNDTTTNTSKKDDKNDWRENVTWFLGLTNTLVITLVGVKKLMSKS